jgi:hypothetical protein
VGGDSSKVTRYVKNLRRFFKTLYGIGLVFALNAPDDILTQYPLLHGFTSLMTQIFPAINAVAKRSAFPEVSTLYLSVSWFFSPLYLLYESGKYYCEFDSGTRRFLEARHKQPTRWKWIKHAICILFLIIGFVLFAFYYDGSDFNIAPFNSHRMALGLAGPLIAGGIGVAAIFPALVILIFFQMKWMKIFFKEKRS